MRLISLPILISILLSVNGFSQSDPVSTYFPDIKILESNSPSPGYFFLATKGLTAPGAKHYIAIVDNYGTPVFFRLMPKVSVSMRLLKDGTIGYIHGVPRKLYLMDDMLNVTDTINTIGEKLDGHDWDIDEDGNYHRYVFAQYNRIVDMSQLVTGGNPAAEILETFIQEFDTDNNLLNTWTTEDLFDILDGNEESPFLDFTEANIDYAHLNSVAIYSDTSFIVSTRHMEEITNIDRRTGEIIWRLGGKKSDFQFINDPLGFSHQHCPRRIENGNLILFDNGNLHDPSFSSSVEYELDMVNMTATLINRYARTPNTFAPRDGATQRLANGNTIITWGPVWPSLTEFHMDGSVAIELDMTHHSLSPRIEKYMWETKVFESSADTVDFGMYDGSNPLEHTIQLFNNCDTIMHITSVVTRTNNFSVSTQLPLEMPPGANTDIKLIFDPKDSQIGYLEDVITICSDNESQRIARQVVLKGTQADIISPTVTIKPDSSNVPVDATISFRFSEPVRNLDGSDINFNNIASIISFRKDSQNGIDIQFTASINSEKTLITVKPTAILDSSVTYFINLNVFVEDYSGNLLSSSPTSFTTVGAVSVDNNPFESDIIVYPNPSTGKFRIEVENQELYRISIYSALGNEVFSESNISNSSVEVDFGKHNPGIYLIVLTTKENRLIGTRKLILK